jgi:hypothetical protein
VITASGQAQLFDGKLQHLLTACLQTAETSEISTVQARVDVSLADELQLARALDTLSNQGTGFAAISLLHNQMPVVESSKLDLYIDPVQQRYR